MELVAQERLTASQTSPDAGRDLTASGLLSDFARTQAQTTEASASHESGQAASPRAAWAPPAAPGGIKQISPLNFTREQILDGQRRLNLVLRARELRAQGVSWTQIQLDGLPWRTVYGWYQMVEQLDNPTAEDLASGYKRSGRKAAYQEIFTDADFRLIQSFGLLTNRTRTSGSMEEAARQALKTGKLSAPAAAYLRSRIEARLNLLPDSMRRRLMAAPVTHAQLRNSREASLDYFNSPGSMMWVQDEFTLGREEFIRAGDILEADDATCNFAVCVPWEVGGDDCSAKYKVKVARFQWLVAIDAASRFVPGFAYTARPKSSYRGEDVLSLFHGVFAAHGIWRRARLEQGVWAATGVANALATAGVKRVAVWSPHQKPFIEGLFNAMWTRLSLVPGQVGRFRGEERELCLLLEACQQGHQDPRKHFPMLADVLVALEAAIVEHNAHRIFSEQYGTWIPDERWVEQRDEGRLRQWNPSDAWMFSPCVRKWTVQGNCVGGSVQIADGWSCRFDFTADYLPEFDGAEVTAYFDPAAPDNACEAVLVLNQNVRSHKAGEVIGRAIQFNKVARYTRRVLGWGDDVDGGLAERKAAASYVRRSVRTILPGGRPGLKIDTARTADASVTIQRDGLVPAAEAAPERALRPAKAVLPLKTRSTVADFEALETEPAADRQSQPMEHEPAAPVVRGDDTDLVMSQEEALNQL